MKLEVAVIFKEVREVIFDIIFMKRLFQKMGGFVVCMFLKDTI